MPQRLSSGLLVLRTYQEGGTQVCELADGSWQLGTARGGEVIRTAEQLAGLGLSAPGIVESIRASIERLAQQPAPVQESIEEELLRRVRLFNHDDQYDLLQIVRARQGEGDGSVPDVVPGGAAGLRDAPSYHKTEKVPGGMKVWRTPEQVTPEWIPDGMTGSATAEDELARMGGEDLERDNPDAAPAYPCAYCEKLMPSEQSVRAHQYQCRRNPESRHYREE